MQESFGLGYYYKTGKTPSMLDFHEGTAFFTIRDDGIALNGFINSFDLDYNEIQEMCCGKAAGVNLLNSHYFSIKISKDNSPITYFFLIGESQKDKIKELLKNKGIKEIDNPPYLVAKKSNQKELLILLVGLFLFGVIIGVAGILFFLINYILGRGF
jgi:hypothetical protein